MLLASVWNQLHCWAGAFRNLFITNREPWQWYIAPYQYCFKPSLSFWVFLIYLKKPCANKEPHSYSLIQMRVTYNTVRKLETVKRIGPSASFWMSLWFSDFSVIIFYCLILFGCHSYTVTLQQNERRVGSNCSEVRLDHRHGEIEQKGRYLSLLA